MKKFIYILTSLLLLFKTSFASNSIENFVVSIELTNDEVSDFSNINTHVGADSFYNYSIYGQNTQTAVVEAGTIYKEHEVFENATLGDDYIPTGLPTDYISAHKTACAGIIGGVGPEIDGFYSALTFGIAPKTELCFGSTGDGSTVSLLNYYKTYKYFFETAPVDVISTSESPILTRDVSTPMYQSMIDALAYKNSGTTFVCAAGNSGDATNTVCHIGLNYNGITVGGLGNKFKFDTIADFSSRGASNFYNPLTSEIIKNVRASIDITAPAVDFAIAYYQEDDPNPDVYAIASGTSFSAPTVAGVVSLLTSASKELEANNDALSKGWSANARDSRVIKAVLLNSADKPKDWNNGQFVNEQNQIQTTQSLDFTYGAGMLNAKKALTQYITFDKSMAWDLAELSKGSATLYELGDIDLGKELTATLVWHVQNEMSEQAITEDLNSLSETTTEDVPDVNFTAFADLNLELWFYDGTTLSTIALSDSMYNNVEHLHLETTRQGTYYLRVVFEDLLYGDADYETYALAWSVIPEPSYFALILALLMLLLTFTKTQTRE